MRILHLSDTHNMHRQIERKFGPLPRDVDVVCITGDITVHGDDRAFADFDAWLGEIKVRYGYKHILLIWGNHDWWTAIGRGRSKRPIRADVALDPHYMQSKFRNARVLNHELVCIEGLRIYGSSYCPWQRAANPDEVAVKSFLPRDGSDINPFRQIPFGVHIVLTHGPAAGIFDSCGRHGHWGGSKELKKALQFKKPLAHFSGHKHDQRGFWERTSRSEEFSGPGCEYIEPRSGRPAYTAKPGPSDCPCILISCNPMASEEFPSYIAGPARLIAAQPSSTPEGMNLRVVPHGCPEYLSGGGLAQAAPIATPMPKPSLDAAHCSHLAHSLAQHFALDSELVEDVLATLHVRQLTSQELEVQAMVMLSGMCHDGESSDDGEDSDAWGGSGEDSDGQNQDPNRSDGEDQHANGRGHNHGHRHSQSHGRSWRQSHSRHWHKQSHSSHQHWNHHDKRRRRW